VKHAFGAAERPAGARRGAAARPPAVSAAARRARRPPPRARARQSGPLTSPAMRPLSHAGRHARPLSGAAVLARRHPRRDPRQVLRAQPAALVRAPGAGRGDCRRHRGGGVRRQQLVRAPRPGAPRWNGARMCARADHWQRRMRHACGAAPHAPPPDPRPRLTHAPAPTRAPAAPSHPRPRFVWPLYWLAQGTMFWALFVVGHDCGHQSFSPSRTLNDFVGNIVHASIMVPYHGWRVSHRKHHGVRVLTHRWGAGGRARRNSTSPARSRVGSARRRAEASRHAPLPPSLTPASPPLRPFQRPPEPRPRRERRVVVPHLQAPL
jgi:hypothetical protein